MNDMFASVNKEPHMRLIVLGFTFVICIGIQPIQAGRVDSRLVPGPVTYPAAHSSLTPVVLIV
jgi:hypothetical protein